MSTTSPPLSHPILFVNTLGFTVCFTCWTLNGILVAFLINNGIFTLVCYPKEWQDRALGVFDMENADESITGFWSSSWGFILVLSAVCLIWMHLTATKIMNENDHFYPKKWVEKNKPYLHNYTQLLSHKIFCSQ